MAWLEQRKSGQYHVAFRFGEERFKKSLRTDDRTTAEARLHRLEENIRLVESGRLTIPPDADFAAFLLSDGHLNGKPKTRASIRRLRELCDAFLRSIPSGSLEESTICLMKVHIGHLKRLLGTALLVREIELADLQKYVDRRSREPGNRGNTVSPVTMKKEIATLRSIWNWARDGGHFERPLPLKGLRYPKTAEKAAFQTWAEIEQRIARGGLLAVEEAKLWDCLFLSTAEIDELLKHVQTSALHPFIYPMFVFAAHTGARRSEMLRSQLDDIDFDRGIVTVWERKRARGKLTTRTVPMSPMLSAVLSEWLGGHPGGVFTFCLDANILRSKKHRELATALTRDEAHDHFKRTLAGSKWDKLRGWHVFRHSFCSNCAAAGVDQRIINAWVGHQTEDMVRRYRHLLPNQQQTAIRSVFGEISISNSGRPTPPPASVGGAGEAAAACGTPQTA